MAKDKKYYMEGKASANAVYGLGLIGSLVYYIQQATTLAEGLLGIVKAILWPAFLIYKVLQRLGL